MSQHDIEHDINRNKLLKISSLLQKTGDDLMRDMKSMNTQSLDYLQMQTYILGFQQCFRIVLGVIND